MTNEEKAQFMDGGFVPGLRRAMLVIRKQPFFSDRITVDRFRELIHYITPEYTEIATAAWPYNPGMRSVQEFEVPRRWDPRYFDEVPEGVVKCNYEWIDREEDWAPWYSVEQLFVSTWDDAGWTENDRPMRFRTQEKAQEAIAEFLDDQKEAVLAGHMDEEYDPADYRVVVARRPWLANPNSP